MRPWFDQMTAYVLPDVRLAEFVPETIDDATLTHILGESEDFGYEDARRLMKNQFRTRQEYRDASDLPDERYSRTAMVEMLRTRCRYVIELGSTLNNPHVPASYFTDWDESTVITPPGCASLSWRR
jgi:hypothetical protein